MKAHTGFRKCRKMKSSAVFFLSLDGEGCHCNQSLIVSKPDTCFKPNFHLWCLWNRFRWTKSGQADKKQTPPQHTTGKTPPTEPVTLDAHCLKHPNLALSCVPSSCWTLHCKRILLDAAEFSCYWKNVTSAGNKKVKLALCNSPYSVLWAVFICRTPLNLKVSLQTNTSLTEIRFWL